MSIIEIDKLPPGVGEFVKKPVRVRAMQFTYPPSQELIDWVGANMGTPMKAKDGKSKAQVRILTLEDGTPGSSHQVKHIATEGDWIIQGTKGEFYPCKPDIFEETYQVVNNA